MTSLNEIGNILTRERDECLRTADKCILESSAIYYREEAKRFQTAWNVIMMTQIYDPSGKEISK